MKRWILTAVILTLTLSTGAFAEDTPWFDLEKCSMCKNMSSEEGLMDHMQWENHIIASGMMMVTVVEPEYKPAMGRAMEKMQAVGARLAGGEEMYLCGFCQSYGGLMMSGAKIENFDTKSGSQIMLMTSADADVVAKIHEHAQRTIDEYDKMLEPEAGHEGHSH